jgi:hypothetical protein
VAIAATFKGSWYFICATKGISEILTLFSLDVEGTIDVLDQEGVLSDAGNLGLFALELVHQTQGNSSSVSRRQHPKLIETGVRGVPGSLLTMLIAHDVMGSANINPIYIPQICDHLKDPDTLRATYDLFQLSLALGRMIPRVICLPNTTDSQALDRARSAGERKRDLKHHHKSGQ